MDTQLPLFDLPEQEGAGTLPPDPYEWLEQGAALVISYSGGKDSQAMLLHLMKLHKERGWKGDIVAVHSDLGRAEWSITHDRVLTDCNRFGIECHIVKKMKDGQFYDLIDGMEYKFESRPEVPPFPSNANRWCTSDWKRSVIDVFIRNRYPKDAWVVCAIGLRADESPARKKKPVVEIRESCTAPTKNRFTMNWLPIHQWTVEDVWREIGLTLGELRDMQQTYQRFKHLAYMRESLEANFPAHPSYLYGNERLSCACCILATRNDLMNGAEYNPDTYRLLCDLEARSGKSFKGDLWLTDLRPDLLDPEIVETVRMHKEARNDRPVNDGSIDLDRNPDVECGV